MVETGVGLLVKAITIQVPVASYSQDLIPNECPITTWTSQDLPPAQFGNVGQPHLLTADRRHADSEQASDGDKVVPSAQFERCFRGGHNRQYDS